MVNRPFGKPVGIICTVLLALVLVACGGNGSSTSTVTFQNDTGVAVEGFFVSSTDDGNWGDPLNETRIEAGEQLQVDADALPGDAGTVFDIGAIDENDLIYEVYEVTVSGGDTLSLSADGSLATLTVTSRNGSTTTYEGYTYTYVS